MLRRIVGAFSAQPWWVLSLAIHLLFLTTLYFYHGIITDKEALKYSGCASDVLRGDLSDLLGRYKLFAAYILFLVPFTALGSAIWAIPAQVLLMWWATTALRRSLQRLKVPNPVANAFTIVFLLAYPVQCWVLSLYSEAFFIPLTILFLERSSRKWGMDAGTLALAILVVFSRPTGVLLVLPVLVWGLSSRIRVGRTGLKLAGVLVVLGAMAFTPVMNDEQLDVVAGSPVICGFPEHPGTADGFQGTTLAAVQRHVIIQHGPRYWAGLVLRRSFSLLIPYRSYFSDLHNGLGIAVVLLYPLAFTGLWRRWRDPFVQVILLVLVLNTLLVGLTYDEWGTRFLSPLLPLIILLAAAAWPSPMAPSEQATSSVVPRGEP